MYFYTKCREIKAKTLCWIFGILLTKLLSFSRSLELAPALGRIDDNIYLGLIIYATDKYLLVRNAASRGETIINVHNPGPDHILTHHRMARASLSKSLTILTYRGPLVPCPLGARSQLYCSIFRFR